MQKNALSSYSIICALVILASSFVTSGCAPTASPSTAKNGTTHTIKNKGSDTMVNLAQAWAERYTGISSTASVEVSGGGS